MVVDYLDSTWLMKQVRHILNANKLLNSAFDKALEPIIEEALKDLRGEVLSFCLSIPNNIFFEQTERRKEFWTFQKK